MTTPTRQPEQPANAGMTAEELEAAIANVLDVLYQTEVLKSFARICAAARQAIPPAPTSDMAAIMGKVPAEESDEEFLAQVTQPAPTSGMEEVIARLYAIVNKLPKTADSVPIVPGMKLWIIDRETMKPVAWTALEVASSWVMVKEQEHELGPTALQSAWSSREYAIAALALSATSPGQQADASQRTPGAAGKAD